MSAGDFPDAPPGLASIGWYTADSSSFRTAAEQASEATERVLATHHPFSRGDHAKHGLVCRQAKENPP
jgi:hypothetical protein